MKILLKKDFKTVEFLEDSTEINVNDDLVHQLQVELETPLMNTESLFVVYEEDETNGRVSYRLPLFNASGIYVADIPSVIIQQGGTWIVQVIKRRESVTQDVYSEIAAYPFTITVGDGVKNLNGNVVTISMVTTLYHAVEDFLNTEIVTPLIVFDIVNLDNVDVSAGVTVQNGVSIDKFNRTPKVNDRFNLMGESTTQKIRAYMICNVVEVSTSYVAYKINEVSILGGAENELTEEDVKKIVQENAVTTESDPTIPNWAKQDQKPTYSYSEILDAPNFSEYQTKQDDTLDTESKEVVGAINEVNNRINDVADLTNDFNTDIADLMNKTNELEEAMPTGIGSSVDETTNVLTVELKDKNGNVIATTDVTLPSGSAGNIDLSAFVKFTDYVDDGNKSGVVRVSPYRGIQAITNGLIVIRQPKDSYIDNRNGGEDTATTFAVTLSKFDYTLRKALTDGQIVLTDEEKAKARALLGIE